MNYRVIVSPRAMADIEENTWWWAEHRSPDQALRWYERAIATLYGLAISPERYPRAAESEKVECLLREVHFGLGSHPTHRAIYTLAGDELRVIAVRAAIQAELTADDITTRLE